MLGASTQFAEQFPVIFEKSPQDLRHAEYVLPMGNRIQDIRLQVCPKLDYFLGVAGRTKPATTAAERKQVLVVAVRAADPGESLVQIPAVKIFADNPRNDRP